MQHLHDSDTESVDAAPRLRLPGFSPAASDEAYHSDSMGPRMPAFGGLKLDFGGSHHHSADAAAGPPTEVARPRADDAAAAAAGRPKASGGLLSLLGLAPGASQQSLDAKWQSLQRQRQDAEALAEFAAYDDDYSGSSHVPTDVVPGGGLGGMGGRPGMGMGLGLNLGGDSASSNEATEVAARPHQQHQQQSKLNEDFDGSYDITANGTLQLRDFRIRKEGVRLGSAISHLSQADLVQTGNLGSGASGKVIRCLHRPTGLVIALKSIDITDKARRDQLVQELQELEETNCGYLVGFYNSFFADGLMHLALEYMDRGSLQSIVEDVGPLAEPVLAEVSRRMLLGLAFLHKGRKIHRDIKPGNVLVNSHGEVKISDFGILARLDEETDDRKTFVGTTVYMSPERIDSQKYSFAGDIWSFGLTLMFCALGRLPVDTRGGYWYVDAPEHQHFSLLLALPSLLTLPRFLSLSYLSLSHPGRSSSASPASRRRSWAQSSLRSCATLSPSVSSRRLRTAGPRSSYSSTPSLVPTGRRSRQTVRWTSGQRSST
jgi:tRNA A-37 threonylcarbamoyl transferase component Bud32